VSAKAKERATEGGHSCPPNGGLENPPSVGKWSSQRIGDLVVRTQQRNPSATPQKRFSYIDVSAVSNTSFRITEPTDILGSEAPSRARKVVHAGDVLFATVRPTLKRVALVPQNLHDQIASTGYIVLRSQPKKLDTGYLYFRLLTDEFIARMRELERGASYPAVRDSDVLDEVIPIPPLAEQRKIAAVLGQVQRAMEQQERLLALTAELKKALLHQLFTHGLRGEPQKESEIGPVPDSWEAVKLGDLFDTQLGKMLSQKARTGDNPKPYLRNKNVQWGTIDISDLLSMDFNERERGKFILMPGDLLICEGGEPGRAALWHGEVKECYYQKALHRLRPKCENITNEFLAHWLEFSLRYQDLYGVAGASSTIAHLPEVQLKILTIPLPPRSEQGAIVECLNGADTKTAQHRRKHAALTALFRTLLHQLMTAQIRVHDLDLPELETAPERGQPCPREPSASLPSPRADKAVRAPAPAP
jgi:type I restriction enzyme S subunit